VETDWRKVVAADDIDAIDICTPNNLHAEIAIEAAKHGKAILCEKPLSMDTAEGEKMCAGRREGGRAEHGLVQLPSHSCSDVRQADHRFRQARPGLPLPRRVSPRLDDQRRPAAGRRGASGGSIRLPPAAA